MKKMYHYATVEKALEELKEKGFSIDYNIEEDKILSAPVNFGIVEIYRYEGMSNPDDEATVYGIQDFTTGDRGFCLFRSRRTTGCYYFRTLYYFK